ncbi:DMT family transporter [Roseicyclus sp. F158]|uniref:DMT family transporter n=1 Tax=Tropicimonas omnivorans TaxID=3075590 RepID=A0ABU3DGM1_9RHOB|nr:DMT family transporter [Roseicyclus sp. F158]MDT0682865.1 DMT family transporter [Roseicyclus sp. F158]
MEPWILATFAAALFQTVRFALQKRLNMGGLSSAGATWARFLWAAPFLVLGLGAALVAGQEMPAAAPSFWLFALGGAVGQIAATIWVVSLFRLRHFAVGITLKKSEILMTAAMGWAILGDTLPLLAVLAILIGACGLVVLSLPERGLRPDGRALMLGLASGAAFAVAGVSYRGATLALMDGSVALRAGVALTIVVVMQTAIMAAWFALSDRPQIVAVLRAWRPGLLVGLTSLAGSYCWFAAFAQMNAAVVQAVGQVELLFGIAGGVLFFEERITLREGTGIAALGASILALIVLT